MQTELYEKLAIGFYTDSHRNHSSLTTGLIEETYEVSQAEATGTRREYLDELGDVLWYVTVMAREEGSSLEEVMTRNYNKLEQRALNGKK